MEITCPDSGPGEALASYRPTSMPDKMWARFRDDALALVDKVPFHDAEARRIALSRLVVYLADQAANRPEASLADLLTREQVAGYLQRALAAGEPPGTVRNRQGTLNRLLRAKAGRPATPRRRNTEPRLSPYSAQELTVLLTKASARSEAVAADLARTVLCAAAGHPLPTSGGPVHVRTCGRDVSVGPLSWQASSHLRLPCTGTLDADRLERALAWGRRHVGPLDRRRLEITALANRIPQVPATTALRLPGIGRDRLTAAAAGAARPDPASYQSWLRDGQPQPAGPCPKNTPAVQCEKPVR